jgi:hypothetical protein
VPKTNIDGELGIKYFPLPHESAGVGALVLCLALQMVAKFKQLIVRGSLASADWVGDSLLA